MKRAGLWAGIALVGCVVLIAVVALDRERGRVGERRADRDRGAEGLGLLARPVDEPDPLRVRTDVRLLGPGWPHLLGTDNYGIDILSMLMYGARVVLMVGIIAVAIAALIGVVVAIAKVVA